MTDTNHQSHDQIAYESWLRRHEIATAGNAAVQAATQRGTR